MSHVKGALFNRAKKSLGQHFLVSSDICQRIVALLQLTADDNVLEIGPGPGALSKILEKAPHKNLLMLEKDRFWARERVLETTGNVLLIDALSFDWPRLPGCWKYVGNLPYNIASPLVWDCLSLTPCWQRAVFMFQKEVAQRICAVPGTSAYGALSVWIQSYATVKLEFYVAPGSFRPAPKVDSAIVSFGPLSAKPAHPQTLARILKICFQQRRKQVGGIFKRSGKTGLSAALERLNLNPELRPEDITPSQFQEIASQFALAAGA